MGLRLELRFGFGWLACSEERMASCRDLRLNHSALTMARSSQSRCTCACTRRLGARVRARGRGRGRG